jgi:hypothetical protein
MQVQTCLEPEIGNAAITAGMASVLEDIQLVQGLIVWADSNAARVAKKIGVANTTINRFVNGSAKTRLGRDTYNKLREAYPDYPPFAEVPEPNGVPFKMEGASEERMQESLPIYGTAIGSVREIDGDAIEQTTLNTAEIVAYAKRPVLLNGKTSAYGLWITGSSMEPRHMEGDTILIDSKGKLRNGEDVVVYLRPVNPEDDDGQAARAVLVKRLVRRTATYVELEQFNPAKVFRVDISEIVRIDRVIPWSELLG